MATSQKNRATPSLSERIVRDLEKTILGGQLRAGDQLPTENVLTQKYDTSRPIVREALRELKARGLAISRRGSGCFVAENAWENPLRLSLERYGALRGESEAFDELLDLRLVVETHCIRKLTLPNATKARERLVERLERMEKVKDDLRAFGSADLAFHFEIVKAADNELFATIYRGLIPSLGERFARATYTDTELTEHTLADHRAITAAVQAQDEEMAVKRLGKHINWARLHMHEILFPVQL